LLSRELEDLKAKQDAGYAEMVRAELLKTRTDTLVLCVPAGSPIRNFKVQVDQHVFVMKELLQTSLLVEKTQSFTDSMCKADAEILRMQVVDAVGILLSTDDITIITDCLKKILSEVSGGLGEQRSQAHVEKHISYTDLANTFCETFPEHPFAGDMGSAFRIATAFLKVNLATMGVNTNTAEGTQNLQEALATLAKTKEEDMPEVEDDTPIGTVLVSKMVADFDEHILAKAERVVKDMALKIVTASAAKLRALIVELLDVSGGAAGGCKWCEDLPSDADAETLKELAFKTILKKTTDDPDEENIPGLLKLRLQAVEEVVPEDSALSQVHSLAAFLNPICSVF
jgi:hypothetical protein